MGIHIPADTIGAASSRRRLMAYAVGFPAWIRHIGCSLGFLSMLAGSGAAPAAMPSIFSPPVTQIAASNTSSCALTADDRVQCWGLLPPYLQITPDLSPVPVVVDGLHNSVAIGAGFAHLCALNTAGAVQCLGHNESGQLGNGSTTDSTAPVAVSGLGSGVAAIAVGGSFSCALTTAGAVKCWGKNASGALGDGTTTDRSQPVPVSGLSSGVIAIAASHSDEFACALTTAGTVQCWGANNHGQLGDDTNIDHYTPVIVGDMNDSVAIAVGDEHACALNSAGALYCWGRNDSGQLGDSTSPEHSIRTQVSGLGSGVTAIAAGAAHTCALTAGGPMCWGSNQSNQLGDFTSQGSSKPIAVKGLDSSSGIVSIVAGNLHTCVLNTTGDMRCWGHNGDSQLGNGTVSGPPEEPAPVVGLYGRVSTPVLGTSYGLVGTLALGTSNLCVLLTEGTAQCAGDDAYGQIGDGKAGGAGVATPNFVGVRGLNAAATAIATNYGAACALTTNGAQCWGNNSFGQLGNGSTANSSTPVAVNNLEASAVAIAIGGGHACALTTQYGSVKCWGDNASGELGNGGGANSSTPVVVSGLDRVASIAAGYHHSCAVREDAIDYGRVYCWGGNEHGQLGNGSTSDSATPVASPTRNINYVTAGDYHTCALAAGGQVLCWGGNRYGQLGNGSTTDSSSPVEVKGFGDVPLQIVAGEIHTCVLAQNGIVWCWGDNSEGQLGDGTTVQHTTPVAVPGLSGVVSIAAGGYNTCALTAANELRCWGSDVNRQLAGFTDVRNRATPAQLNTAQTIAFAAPTSLRIGATAALQASAGTAPVVFDTWTHDICQVDGTSLIVTAKAPGLCGVRASQPGGGDNPANSFYAQAPQQLRLIQVQMGAPQSTTTLTASAASGVYGQNVTFTATVSGKAPSGNVTFNDGATVLCTAALSGGGDSPTATCSSNTLAAGTHSITAAYAGDANNAASTSSPALSYTVAQAATNVSVTLSANSIVLGGSVKVVGNVSVIAPGAGIPTGTITAQIPEGGSCSYSLAAAEPGCSITPKGVGTGTTTMTVSYSGDGNFSASTGTASLILTVWTAKVTLTSSLNPSTVGQAVNFTAQVSQVTIVSVPRGTPESTPQATEPLTGKVTISDGATLLATLTSDANGQVTYSTSSLAAGSHTITATYTGDEIQGAGSATLVQQVGQPLTTASVALSSSPNPSTLGQTVTFTAAVTSQAPASVTAKFANAASANIASAPSGTVVLSDNGTIFANVPLNANGQATYSMSTLSIGSHTITVNYSGDATTAPASSTLVQQVGAASPVSPAPALSPMAMLLLGFGFVGVAGYGFARTGYATRLPALARRR